LVVSLQHGPAAWLGRVNSYLQYPSALLIYEQYKITFNLYIMLYNLYFNMYYLLSRIYPEPLVLLWDVHVKSLPVFFEG